MAKLEPEEWKKILEILFLTSGHHRIKELDLCSHVKQQHQKRKILYVKQQFSRHWTSGRESLWALKLSHLSAWCHSRLEHGEGMPRRSLSEGDGATNLERSRQLGFTDRVPERQELQREDQKISWVKKVCPILLSRMQSPRPLAKRIGKLDIICLLALADRRASG